MTHSLQGLRAATGAIHARLHLHPAFAPLMHTPPDVGGYARLIAQMHGFHAPVEAWLFDAASALLPELDDLPHRRKAHLLRADMAALAGLFPQAAAEAAWAGPLLPLSRPAVLGGLYVIEGATLGGRELGRSIVPALQSLGLWGDEGVRFFFAYEPRQGAMWRQFCAVLNAVSACFTAGERHAMEAAARDVFVALEDWLSRRAA